MKQDYTHISVLLDRTGSMEGIRDDTIGGFNAFLQEQKAQSGIATLTLVQFDSLDPYEVIHRFVLINIVPNLTRETFVPRGSTPLLDAIGHGINDLEAGITQLKADDRPSKVMMVIITDGHENSSQEFRMDQIEKMINDKTAKDGWQFVFLSADMDAIADAKSLGIQPDAALHFARTGQGTRNAWTTLSQSTSQFRTQKNRNIGFIWPDSTSADSPPKKGKN